MRKKWNKEIILQKIRDRVSAGMKLDLAAVKQNDGKLFSVAHYYFGGWKEAVTAAGFDYNDIRIHRPHRWWIAEWPKNRILYEIRRRHQNGEKINSNAIQHKCPDLYVAAKRHFGGWKDAIEAAGYSYEAVHRPPTRSWNRQKIIRAIQDRHKRKLPLNGFAVYLQDRGLYSAVKRYFGRGGWRKALKHAGLDWRELSPKRKWFRYAILSEIRMLYAHSVPLYAHFLERHGYKKMIAGARKIFGGWKEAIESAGFSYDDVRWGERWNKAKVVRCIKKLQRKRVRLNHKSIRLHSPRLLSAAIRYCGSWSEAVAAARIDYKKHSMVFSSKAWLRSLTKEDCDRIKKHFTSIVQNKTRRNVDENNGNNICPSGSYSN